MTRRLISVLVTAALATIGLLALTAGPAFANSGCFVIGKSGGPWPGRWAGVPNLTLSSSTVEPGDTLTVTGVPAGSDVDVCVGAFAGWPQFDFIAPNIVFHLGIADSSGTVVKQIPLDAPSGSYYVTGTNPTAGAASFAAPIVIGGPCTVAGTAAAATGAYNPQGDLFLPVPNAFLPFVPATGISSTTCSAIPVPMNGFKADGVGRVKRLVKMPAGLLNGEHDLVLVGNTSGNAIQTARISFTASTPTSNGVTFAVSPDDAIPHGPPNQTVTVNATGLDSDDTYQVIECGPGYNDSASTFPPATFGDCSWSDATEVLGVWHNGVTGIAPLNDGSASASFELADYDCGAGDLVVVALADTDTGTLTAWQPINIQCGLPPAGQPQVVSTTLNTAKAFTLNGADPDDDPVTYEFDGPSHGELSGTAPELTYTPDAGFVGDDSFTYTMDDGAFTSATVTVTIHVFANATIECDVVTRSIPINGSLSLQPLLPLIPSVCTATNGGTPTFSSIASGPVNGDIDFAGVYRPDPGFEGFDTILVNLTAAGSPVATGTGTLNIIVGDPDAPKIDQSIDFAPLTDASLDDVTVVVGAASTSGLPVEFSTTTPDVCTAGGTLGATITLVDTGTCTVQADQPGNVAYNPAPAVQQSFDVTPGGGGEPQDQTIDFDALGGIPYGDAAPTPSATATSGLTVEFSSNTPSVCTVVGSVISVLTAGQCEIQADQPGDVDFSPAQPVTQSFTIAKAALAVNADPQSRPYGSANPLLTATLTGFVNGEQLGTSDVSGVAACGTTALIASLPGGFPITCAVGSLTSGNYTFGPFNASTLTVTKALLTVTANSKSRVYKAANGTLGVTYSGFVLAQTKTTGGVSGSPSCTTTAMKTSPVGPYPIACTQGTLASTRYSFAFVPGTLTVQPKELKVKPNTASRMYGSSDPTFTVKYTGFASGESATAPFLTGAPSCSSGTTSSSPVGSYTITCSVGGLNAPNYFFTFLTGTLKVTKATLTVTAENKSRPAGTPNPPLTFTVTGFVNGESYTAPFLTGAPICTTTAKLTSVAGKTFPIKCTKGTLAAPNYQFVFVAGTLTVT